MNTLFIKIIFLIFTTAILFYTTSYVKFEITKNNNIIGGIMVFIFSVVSVILGNVVFFIA